MLRFLSLAVVLASTACATTGDDADPGGHGGKADDAATCSDPHYGDGTCQVDLACGLPDIDCFVAFATDAEAATWATERFPAATVAETDPVFSRARALLDRAWGLYTADVPLGKLADKRIAAVVLEDSELNAFAMADGAPGMVGLSVQMNRGLFTLTDDEIVGVLLHELTHVVRLHVLDEVANRTRRFYIAATPEQLGASAPENAHARDAGTAWRTAADLIGVISDPALGAAPFDGNLGSLFANYAGPCSTEAASIRLVLSTVRLDELSQSYVLPESLATQLASALPALRSCAATDPLTLRMELAALDPSWAAYLTPLLTDAGYLDRPFVDAVLAIGGERRAALRKLETDFTAATGAPWSALRFYSVEEEADDYGTRVATHAHLPDDIVTSASLSMLAGQRAACETAIAAGTAPYGELLTDDHHGDCWRVMHGRQVAASAGSPATTSRLAPAETWTPTHRELPHPVY